jgi:hypothetical protein
VSSRVHPINLRLFNGHPDPSPHHRNYKQHTTHAKTITTPVTQRSRCKGMLLRTTCKRFPRSAASVRFLPGDQNSRLVALFISLNYGLLYLAIPLRCCRSPESAQFPVPRRSITRLKKPYYEAGLPLSKRVSQPSNGLNWQLNVWFDSRGMSWHEHVFCLQFGRVESSQG